jgi:hypothetical protein
MSGRKTPHALEPSMLVGLDPDEIVLEVDVAHEEPRTSLRFPPVIGGLLRLLGESRGKS